MAASVVLAAGGEEAAAAATAVCLRRQADRQDQSLGSAGSYPSAFTPGLDVIAIGPRNELGRVLMLRLCLLIICNPSS